MNLILFDTTGEEATFGEGCQILGGRAQGYD